MNFQTLHCSRKLNFLHFPKRTLHHNLPKFPSNPPFPSNCQLSISLAKPTFQSLNVSKIEPLSLVNERSDQDVGEFEDLGVDGDVYRNTLRLVECSMFAAVSGLVYFLSTSLSIENYFGCFFSLPIVISSLRWGIAAGRKTMVATAMLLFVLSGPARALIYLLTHGILGITMGSLWRLKVNWGLSIFLCTLARSVGAVGYVLTTSFLIRENILALITINIHATLTFVFAAVGINIAPSMNAIYAIFTILVLLNCGFFVLLVHLLYSVFLTRLGMKSLLRLPGWLERGM